MSEPAAAPSADPAPGTDVVAGAASADMLRGRIMRRSLQVLLDQVPNSRDVFPHLAVLEAALGERGAAAIDGIPPQFVTKMFAQLRVLPLSSGDAALQDLVGLLQRVMRRNAKAAEQTHVLSPFDPEATVVITEGSHSDFMDALGAQGSQPSQAGA
jgi:hypothetical protein